MSHRSRQIRARIMVLGAPRVGKSAFVVRYITKRFIGEYDHSRDMTYTHKTTLDKDEYLLDLVDTATQHDDVGGMDSMLRSVDAFLLLYSITDRESFEQVRHLYARIHSCSNLRMEGEQLHLPVVVVGNKRDLLHLRKVTQNERERLGTDLGCPTLEISVAENVDDVNEAMTSLLRLVMRSLRNSAPEKATRSSTFDNMKRVFRRKIARSKSDSLYKLGHL